MSNNKLWILSKISLSQYHAYMHNVKQCECVGNYANSPVRIDYIELVCMANFTIQELNFV